MDNIQITLPDGATREVPRGTTAAEIARQISPRLAKEALVARADGNLVDLSRPLEQDTKISILTAKDPDAVQVFRHTAAHLLGAAVLEAPKLIKHHDKFSTVAIIAGVVAGVVAFLSTVVLMRWLRSCTAARRYLDTRCSKVAKVPRSGVCVSASTPILRRRFRLPC